jgi:hypothetical protein
VTGLQFVAAIVNALAWPAAVVVVLWLLRQELPHALRRLQSLELPGGAKVTFATTLSDVQRAVAVAAEGAESPYDGKVVRQEVTEFSAVKELAATDPRQAVIDAWGLLEYHLIAASDKVAPGQPHTWPQVALNLNTWDKWAMLYPAVLELRSLRDHTVRSSRPPSSADAVGYVLVAQELATTIRTAFMSSPTQIPVVAND